MSESRKERWEEYFFPIETIEAVADGDLDACSQVVKEFERYIIKTCTRKVADRNGIVHKFVDEDMLEAVQSHLLNALLCKYKILPLEV